jgi:hypothetical protein
MLLAQNGGQPVVTITGHDKAWVDDLRCGTERHVGLNSPAAAIYLPPGGRTAVAINTSLDGRSLAICPACGYPTWGEGLCALCVPTAADKIGLAIDASDFNPAA